MDFRKLLHRRSNEAPGTTAEPFADAESAAAEYQRIILEQLALGGISTSAIALEVRRFGHTNSLPVFVGMLRLRSWHRQSAFRMLLGLPMVEDKVRRAMAGTWLQDASYFAGLWLHASAQLKGTPAFHELGAVIMHLEDTEGWEHARTADAL